MMTSTATDEFVIGLYFNGSIQKCSLCLASYTQYYIWVVLIFLPVAVVHSFSLLCSIPSHASATSCLYLFYVHECLDNFQFLSIINSAAIDSLLTPLQKILCGYDSEQWFSTRGDPVPRGCLAMSGDIFDHHNLDGGVVCVTGIFWVETRGAAKRPTMHGDNPPATRENSPAQNVNRGTSLWSSG